MQPQTGSKIVIQLLGPILGTQFIPSNLSPSGHLQLSPLDEDELDDDELISPPPLEEEDELLLLEEDATQVTVN